MSSTGEDWTEQLFDLQSQLAFQEETIVTLDRTLIAQQQRIDQLEATLRRMDARFAELVTSLEPQGDEPPPPHY